MPPLRLPIAVCVSLLLAPLARAADVPALPAPTAEERETEARTLVRRGLAAHARGEHEAALADYEQAAALVPDANLPWLYRAEALRALGRADAAVAAYERYLAMDAMVVDAAAVRSRIEELRAKRRGTAIVRTTPNGANVRDEDLGTMLGQTPLTVLLAQGRHRLAIVRAGFVTQHLELDVVAAETQHHALVLVAVQPTRAHSASPCRGRRVGGVVLGGVGLAGLAIGAFLDAAVAGAARSDFQVARDSGDNAAAATANDRYQSAGLGAGTAYVLGSALTVAGGAVALWPCPRRAPAPTLGFRF